MRRLQNRLSAYALGVQHSIGQHVCQALVVVNWAQMRKLCCAQQLVERVEITLPSRLVS